MQSEREAETSQQLQDGCEEPTTMADRIYLSGWNMPNVGSEFLFFLNSRNKIDWEIVTAYELTENGIRPLDESSQFEALRGKPSIEVLKQVSALINRSASELPFLRNSLLRVH